MLLQFTYQALQDLKRLRAFIEEKNPQAAQRISQELQQSIHLLVDQPKLGKRVEGQAQLREWIKGDYIVRYIHNDNAVVIITLWHSRESR